MMKEALTPLRKWIYDLFPGSQLLKNFTLQSCRKAATNKAKTLNVNMEDILTQCCWKDTKSF